MKKMIAMLLVAASVLSFCGCAGENTAPETTQAPAAVSMVTEAAATATYRPLKGSYYRTIGMAIPNWKPASPALRHFISEVQSIFKTG